MNQNSRIGILTSGGDCAGLNAAIRAAVQRADGGYGWKVIGIHDGSRGLLERPMRYEELSPGLFTGDILRMGGTILGTTTHGDPFAYPMPDGTTQDISRQFVSGFQELGLSGLIVIGGDGSLKILQRLAELGGIPIIGIPKTIDNDVPLTEYAIGFTTALSTAVEALDRLLPTAESHERVMILEVMGRDAGHIALSAGIAGGADVILIPEIPFDIEKVAAKINRVREHGRNHSLVVVAEAAHPLGEGARSYITTQGYRRYGGVGQLLSEQISDHTGSDTRVTVLGHVQRGGIPSSHDRIVASAFGVRAVDLLAEGKTGRMVSWQHRQVVDVSLDEVNQRTRAVSLDDTLVCTARGLGISLGD